MSAVHLLSNFGLLGFSLAAVVYLASFQRSQRQILVGRLAFTFLAAATAAITGALALTVGDASFAETAALLLTAAIGWLALVGHIFFNMRLVGAFVAPLATLILLVKFFVAPAAIGGVEPPSDRIIFDMHIVTAVLGEAFAIIACAVSVVFLWQQNLLKKKLLDQLPNNLPAIDRLDRILSVALWCGFLFLTMSLLTGALHSELNAGRIVLNLLPKVIWAIGVWTWYLAILIARNVFNRPSKRIAQMSLAGFLLLAVSYFGMFFRPLTGG